MARVYQTKKPYKADNDDLLQASEEALRSIEGAMETLRGYWELDNVFESLGDAYDELKELFDQYDAIAAEEYRQEIEGLTRDYYRSVI